MADRYQSNRPYRERSDRAPDYDDPRGYRQQDQFSSAADDAPDGYHQSYGQMGEAGYPRENYQAEPRYETGWNRNERYGAGEAGYSRREEPRGQTAYRPGRYQPAGRGFASFTTEDQGGRDFSAPTRRRGYGSYDARMGVRPTYGYGGGEQLDRDGRLDDYSGFDGHRGWFDRASDEVASWFGDDSAARRREMDHRGRGPQNYTRSDERILEDACDNLTDDWAVDARNIQVTVKDGEVTLDGTVPSRNQKRRAEDCVDCISAVGHVQNNLRVQERREAPAERAPSGK
ncbi:BON domain-containing protein [Croceibacterium aestuarii]|uniref:BON domain-containing protein n=1 Tax=Croceibacterium aestuarii TaxID=3064139 RepID=UPI00272E88D0|nr:BON domain-containing protein [Croceibacterium sp. D39]